MSSMEPGGADLFAGVVPFVATAEARSFRAAARRLGVTPSAISKAIARLEADLGVRLLHRTSRAVTLTSDGEGFFARCQGAVEQVRGAREAAAQAQRAPRGTVRVSLPLALGRLVIVPALPRLLGRHPGLVVEAVLTDRMVKLPEERIDAVVRFGPLDDSSAVARRLRPAAWVTAAAPAYLARHGTPTRPAELADHNCLVFRPPSGSPHAWQFVDRPGGKPIAVQPRGNLTADHGDALVSAAVAGLGVLHALDFMIAGELARGELVELFAGREAPGLPLAALAAPGRAPSPRVRAFLDFMVELLGERRASSAR